MSDSTSIDIELAKTDSTRVSPSKVIQNLLKHGWTLNDNGQVTFLPIGKFVMNSLV